MPGGKHGARAIADDDYDDDYYDGEEEYYDEDGEYEQDSRDPEPHVSKTEKSNTEHSEGPSTLTQDEEELNSLLSQLIPDFNQSQSNSSHQASPSCQTGILQMTMPPVANGIARRNHFGDPLTCNSQ